MLLQNGICHLFLRGSPYVETKYHHQETAYRMAGNPNLGRRGFSSLGGRIVVVRIGFRRRAGLRLSIGTGNFFQASEARLELATLAERYRIFYFASE